MMMISFICPALNEESILEKTIIDFLEKADSVFCDYEIILIDDGSVDRTWNIMQNLQSKFPKKIKIFKNAHNKNIGYCFKKGVENALSPYVQMICADVTYSQETYKKIKEMLGSFDILVPYVSNIREEKRLLRMIVSNLYQSIINSFFGLRFKYYNGLPVFKVEHLKKINIYSSGFFYQAECIVKLKKMGSTHYEFSGEMGGNLRKDLPRALTLKNLIDVTKSFIKVAQTVNENKVSGINQTRPPKQ